MSLWLLLIACDPVPVAGRPGDFSGAVGGPFVVRLTPDSTNVFVDEAFGLTLHISGPGDLAHVRRPDLKSLPSFAQRFIVDDLPDGERRPDAVNFRYACRPRDLAVDRIPAVKFVYYRPALHLFQTAWSEAVPIVVTPRGPSSDEVGIADRIRAARMALAAEPGSLPARRDLAAARSAVVYPSDPDVAASLQPERAIWPSAFQHVTVKWAGYAAMVVIGLVLARWRQARRRNLILAVLLVPVALIPPMNFAVDSARSARERAAPTVIVRRDTDLRVGNGPDYPLRTRLPAGAEARKLGGRSGWLQVEFAGGWTGWVVEGDVLP